MYLGFLLRKYSLSELTWPLIICIPFQSAFKKTGSICTFEDRTALRGTGCLESLYSIKQVGGKIENDHDCVVGNTVFISFVKSEYECKK